MPQYAPSIDVTLLNGADGVRFQGIDTFDGAGAAVAGVGDLNGDGYADLIIGAPDNGGGATNPGAAFVVLGAASGWSGSFDLSSLDGGNGFQIVGANAMDEAGFSLDGVGDVNGDGIDDLIVGAWNATRTVNTGAGATYVIYGSTQGFSASIDLSTLDGVIGSRFDGVDSDDNSGHSVAGVGDVNGDGLSDFIIGAYPANSGAGESYVVFGAAGGWPSSFSLASLDGDNGFRIDGEFSTQWSGYSVAAAGDVNGDGFDDILAGARQDGSHFQGAAYVVFGAADGWGASLNLGDLDGANGFKIPGTDNNSFVGEALSSAGDINGDGYDDIVIGVQHADPDGVTDAGSTYVVFGAAGGWASSFDLSTLNGANGFRIDGEAASDFSGGSVAGVGDFNGDGYADLIIGAPEPFSGGADVSAGQAYVVFGAASGFSATLDVSALDGDNGFRIDGVAMFDAAGQSVASVGDFNGDGIDDILVGAPGATPGSTADAGAAYLIFGARPGEAVVRVGTGIDNHIFGSALGDQLSGLGGNDVLDGGAGADALDGGGGSDTASYEHASGFVWVRMLTPASNAGEATGDTYISIENLRGSRFGDLLGGDDNANTLWGMNGADTLQGNGGNDVLIGGAGADVLGGGAGADTADYSTSSAAVTVNLQTGVGSGGDAQGDAYASIENITGSAFDDVLTGRNGFANTLDGSDGNDLIAGGQGADTLIGGNGTDTLDYSNSFNGVDIRLFQNTAAGGDANGDSISGFENIIGSTKTDTLAGDDGVNVISGGSGNETITGRDGGDHLNGDAGNDTLLGGNGDDVLIGGAGNDTLGGGTGNDTADYSASGAAITVSLQTGAGSGGDAQGDTLVSIENVIGSAFADIIAGKNNWDNVLDGGAGSDTLSGGTGNDTFVFHANDANGDTVLDFSHTGAGNHDHLEFDGYGTAAQGANLVQIDATHWQINSADGTIHDTLIIANAVVLTSGDYIFGGG